MAAERPPKPMANEAKTEAVFGAFVAKSEAVLHAFVTSRKEEIRREQEEKARQSMPVTKEKNKTKPQIFTRAREEERTDSTNELGLQGGKTPALFLIFGRKNEESSMQKSEARISARKKKRPILTEPKSAAPTPEMTNAGPVLFA